MTLMEIRGNDDFKTLNQLVGGSIPLRPTNKIKGLWINVHGPFLIIGSPNGNRTCVSGVRGRYPRPLTMGPAENSFMAWGMRIRTSNIAQFTL